MRDSTGWEECVGIDGADEKAMLKRMVEAVAERDPDVIEGHNLFAFDLPFIETRARMHRVRLGIGRQGKRLRSRPSRFTAGERTSSYRRYVAWGRHIVDTMHMAQLYDVSHRDLDSYGLKSVALHFGVSAVGRTYVEGEEISALYWSDRKRLAEYAMDDVRETDAISRILSPSSFYQAQVVPFSYQSCVTRGNAARIDAMLVADYLLHDCALPKASPARPFAGGLTESFESGVFRNVWHIDVRSLYPSIIVSRGINPASDRRGTFHAMLSKLREFRLAAKSGMRQAPTRAVRDHFDALQSSFKILINSFYGYLGFGGGTFNDFDQAEKVTSEGRRILSLMVDMLRQRSARVIEIDTDGIYFVPPEGVGDAEAFTAAIQAGLPDGIEVELDARHAAMFCYKAKNYALLNEDGSVKVTGAALKSRGLEPFQRQYMRKLVELLLLERPEEAGALRDRMARQIADHALPLADLAKRETLSTAPARYREKLDKGETRRSAAYELVLASDRDYRQGDQVAFYVTGDKKRVSVTDHAKLLADAEPGERDENVPYYLDKLDKLHAKFSSFVQPPRGVDGLPLFA
jgi:DNA polymerase elongation subunit (family B)